MEMARIVVLACVMQLLLISTMMFMQGFLLTRHVVNATSTCSVPEGELGDPIPPMGQTKTPCVPGCWQSASFKKAILLVVDALRFDFMWYNESLGADKAPPYHNRMVQVHKLLSKHPENSRLYRFVAHAPTTTQQRLKGLTTGSLPTFIDAGLNFASEEITEDNLIDQLLHCGRNLTVLGDDTWGSLFPRSHVASQLKEDTVLFVLGDHGMTRTGDHGGDSDDEVTAGLLAYSPELALRPTLKTFPSSGTGSQGKEDNDQRATVVAQVDLVPTLALLLGVPIPHANLGLVMEDLLVMQHGAKEPDGALQTRLQALALNARQVDIYLGHYQHSGGNFPPKFLERLETLREEVRQAPDTAKKLRAYHAFLMEAREMCEEVWARFDLPQMMSGLSLAVLVLVLAMVLLLQKELRPVGVSMVVLTVLVTVAAAAAGSTQFIGLGLAATVGVAIFVLHVSRAGHVHIPHFSFGTVMWCGVALLGLAGLSNSFVVSEDRIWAFALASAVCLEALHTSLATPGLSKGSNGDDVWKQAKRTQRHVSVCAAAVVVVAARCSSAFWKCREEQNWCQPNHLHTVMPGLPQDARGPRLLWAAAAALVLAWAPCKWLAHCGNANGSHLSVQIARVGPWLCSALTIGFWALQAAPLERLDTALLAYVVLPPRFLFAVVAVSITLILMTPHLVYQVPPTATTTTTTSQLEVMVPQLVRALQEQQEHRRRPPVVYGLATAVSAPCVLVAALIVPLLSVLAGDGATPALVLLVVCQAAALLLTAAATASSATSKNDLIRGRGALVWFIISIYGFYLMGHQPTLPSLHWTSAFVGFREHSTTILPAIMIAINTYSSHILVGLTLPLVILAPLALPAIFPSIKNTSMEGLGRGELLLLDNVEATHSALWRTSLSYISLHAFKVICTMVAALVLRRHLMVWKIFAPHVIFEAAGLVVTCVSVLAGNLIFLCVFKKVDRWTEELSRKHS
ncbi:phosphatidylinositol glycan anchor biosynthesis class O isoform X2 [Oratosquilla oratoria]|uniref:phosphatidylinositol glycan anchor biosynthesis class O isoform X2 n=1 Tax=Oratosquilla oratoria TaxID=337810 RepID=UPI003F760FC6